MTFDRATASPSGTGGSRAADHGVGPGKQTLVQQVRPVDPRAAATTDLGTQLATISDAAQQLQHAVVPNWYKALERLQPDQVAIAGATAMMQWSRIALTEGQLGDHHAAAAPMIQAARNEIAELGLRRMGGAVIALNPQTLDGDPMTFIQARIAQARTCIARARRIMDMTTPDKDGQRQLDDAGRAQLANVLDAYPDPVEVRWLEAACGRFKLNLRMQADHHGNIRKRLTHAQDHGDLSHAAGHDVDPALAERISNDVDRMRGLVASLAGEGPYIAILRAYTPKDRALLLGIAKQRDVLFNMVQGAGGDNADDLIAVIREAPGYAGFGHDASRATMPDLDVGHATSAIGTEMARQAPGAITRAAAGAVDSFSSIPLVGRATHWAADKLRDGSDALYDATGASKEGRGIANALSETSGAIAATAASMSVSGPAKAATAAKTAVEVADDASTVKKVIESIHDFGEIIEGASEAWRMFGEIASLAASTVVDAAAGTALGDAKRSDRAVDSLGKMIDVYLKRLEPAEKAKGSGVGFQIRVTLLSAIGSALKEIKQGLLDAVKKSERVNVREIAIAGMAGFINGATFGVVKDQLNHHLQGFLMWTARQLLERNHPTAVKLLETVGEKPIKRLIEFVEEKLEVEKKLQHAIEPVVARLAGEHAEHGEGGEHAEHGHAAEHGAGEHGHAAAGEHGHA